MRVSRESSLGDCLNVKELFAWNKCDIRKFGDCNGIGPYNHLFVKNAQPFDYELNVCGFESRCNYFII